MKEKYISHQEDIHARNEEMQWCRIFRYGNPYASLLLVYDQKLCAIAHEVAAAFVQEGLNKKNTTFYINRIHARLSTLISLLQESETNFAVLASFLNLSKHLEMLHNNNNNDLDFHCKLLQKLPEEIHILSHCLCDELEQKLQQTKIVHIKRDGD